MKSNAGKIFLSTLLVTSALAGALAFGQPAEAGILGLFKHDTKGATQKDHKDEFRRLSIDEMKALLAEMPEGARLMKGLADRKTKVVYDKALKPGHHGYYSVAKNKIGLYRPRNSAEQVRVLLAMLHEAGHLDERERAPELMGQNVFYLYNPSVLITIGKFEEADANLHALVTAWQFKEQGNPELWQYAKERSVTHRPMVKAFEDAVAADPEALTNGQAHRAAFDAWFANEKLVRHYERNYLASYQARREKYFIMTRYDCPDLPVFQLVKYGGWDEKNYLKLGGARKLDDAYYMRIHAPDVAIVIDRWEHPEGMNPVPSLQPPASW